VSQSPPPSRRPQLEALETRALPDANAFVTGLYQTILQRNPSASEVAGWVNNLNAGETKDQVSLSFLFGAEHLTNVINHDYATFLGRSPDAGGFVFWFNQLANGFPEEEMVANMVGSQEFVLRNGDGTQAAWLNSAYQSLLGRGVDSGGLNFWGSALANGASMQQVASGILHSVEAETSFVNATYQSFLNRGSDSAGLGFWVNVLQQGATRYFVEEQFTVSQEFENVH
jgi:hypothetical protein